MASAQVQAVLHPSRAAATQPGIRATEGAWPERQPAPEFTAGQSFTLAAEDLLVDIDHTTAQGHPLKPVLIGPLTYLWLGKATTFDKLDLLDALLPAYNELLVRLAERGVEWVQLDEPILTLELPQAWKSAFERAYHMLQYSPLKKLLAAPFGSLDGNLGLAATLPVAGLHVDLARAPEQLPAVLDRLPVYKVLSVGLGDRETPLEDARLRFGENLWLSDCAGASPGLEPAAQGDAALQRWLALTAERQVA
jgi:5-methyltetrahydropteroyltriglutamate--homocysteine methyltransferase